MALTRKRATRLHRQLWNWLADNPDKSKSEWPEWEWNGGKIQRMVADCPACEFASTKSDFECSICPVVWPGVDCQHKRKDMLAYDGLFSTWEITDYELHPRKRVNLARKIADLPERKV